MQCRLKWDGGALNRPVLLLVVALVASLLQSCPLPTGTCNDCDDSNPSPCGDREYRPETGLEIANDGVLTTDPDVVISGESSILGTHAGDGSYSPYLRTKKSILRFSPESTYTVKFNYRIVAEPDEGFELLFYSPVGGAEGNWLPSLVITGEAGETGSAELTSTLGPYTDYEVPWNIIGTGSIAVDDIEVTDSTGGLFAVENAELSCLYPAQALLPPGRVGRSYAAASAVLGGVPPYLITTIWALHLHPAAWIGFYDDRKWSFCRSHFGQITTASPAPSQEQSDEKASGERDTLCGDR